MGVFFNPFMVIQFRLCYKCGLFRKILIINLITNVIRIIYGTYSKKYLQFSSHSQDKLPLGDGPPFYFNLYAAGD